MDLYHYHHFFQNRTPMPSFGPLNKFAQDEKVEVEHVLEQCELCLGELSTFGFFLVLDFSGVKEKRFDGFIIVWLCESPIFGWFTFPFSENSPVILWMKSTFLDDFSNNFCFLTYCARKKFQTAKPYSSTRRSERSTAAAGCTFGEIRGVSRLVKKWEPSFRGK